MEGRASPHSECGQSWDLRKTFENFSGVKYLGQTLDVQENLLDDVFCLKSCRPLGNVYMPPILKHWLRQWILVIILNGSRSCKTTQERPSLFLNRRGFQGPPTEALHKASKNLAAACLHQPFQAIALLFLQRIHPQCWNCEFAFLAFFATVLFNRTLHVGLLSCMQVYSIQLSNCNESIAAKRRSPLGY